MEILGSAAAAVSAGKTYHLVCRTFGSRPAANITWWIGDRQLTGDSQAVRATGRLAGNGDVRNGGRVSVLSILRGF